MEILSRLSGVLLAAVLVSAVFAAPLHQSRRASPQETESPPADRSFKWLSADSEMVGQQLRKPRLRKLGHSIDYVDTEEEVTEVDAYTTRILVRSYRRDAQGHRRLALVVEEERTVSPDGSRRAVRTNSTVDLDRRMRVTGRETQETVPHGSDGFRTVTTIERPNGQGSLTPVERIEQTERRSRESAVEIERTASVVDPNGRWATVARRTGYIQEAAGVIRIDESLYRPDGRGRLSLSEQAISLEWQEDDGTEYRTTETQIPNQYGRMELVSELVVTKTVAADGSSQTVQETAIRSLASPSDELQLIERIVETNGPRGEMSETSVDTADTSGRLHRVNSFTAVTTRSPDGRKTLRKVTGPGS